MSSFDSRIMVLRFCISNIQPRPSGSPPSSISFFTRLHTTRLSSLSLSLAPKQLQSRSKCLQQQQQPERYLSGSSSTAPTARWRRLVGAKCRPTTCTRTDWHTDTRVIPPGLRDTENKLQCRTRRRQRAGPEQRTHGGPADGGPATNLLTKMRGGR